MCANVRRERCRQEEKPKVVVEELCRFERGFQSEPKAADEDKALREKVETLERETKELREDLEALLLVAMNDAIFTPNMLASIKECYPDSLLRFLESKFVKQIS